MNRLDEIVKLVNGRLSLPSDIGINGASSVSRAESSFITLVTSPAYMSQFEAGLAAAAVVPIGMISSTKPCIEVENPEAAFAKIVELFRPTVARKNFGISPQALISPSAMIEEDVCIHAGAVIMDNVVIGCGTVIYPNVTVMENSRIGAHVRIFPGAVLYENTVVGDRSIIHANAVIGAFGFGYSNNEGTYQLCPQLGNVVLGTDVEIGANTTIDRGTYDSTTIGDGTKLDNLVMVGHNCQIGKHNLFCSQVGIAGSCETGDYVVMGGQVGLADHLKIGNKVSIGAQSGVMNDIEDKLQVFGSPARPWREEMQILATKGKLPEMRKSIRDLEREMLDLQQQVGNFLSGSDSVEPIEPITRAA